jgi:hypothetical protein
MSKTVYVKSPLHKATDTPIGKQVSPAKLKTALSGGLGARVQQHAKKYQQVMTGRKKVVQPLSPQQQYLQQIQQQQLQQQQQQQSQNPNQFTQGGNFGQ